MKPKKVIPTKSKAQAMVEFALALPLLMLLLYGLLEAGRLLFLYSTVVTASRQAVRYGSATGVGTNGAARFQDCIGMKTAAQRLAFLGPFDAIDIGYDAGPGKPTVDHCDGDTDPNVKIAGNSSRVVVTISEQFKPILPANIVPFLSRTITARSARTILNSVAIVVDEEFQPNILDNTTIEIDSDNPDPSELGQAVQIVFTVTDTDDPTKPPTGPVVVITSDGLSCTYTLIPTDNGIGDCTITFTTSGTKTITASYDGDDSHKASVPVSVQHMVQLAPTITTIVSDLPDPSFKNDDVVVNVTVTGGSTPPTGTVNVTAGGNIDCVVTLLSNGMGSCTLNFGKIGSFSIDATYSGDSTHQGSSDANGEPHQVLAEPPTPTPTPTLTPIPTITPTPTIAGTPTITPTAVPVCNAVTHGPLVKYGNSLLMDIHNPYSFPLTTGGGSVTWNHDKGHQTGSDKTLKLLSATLNGTTIWDTGPTGTGVWTMPFATPAVIPANSTVWIVFYFHQSYDNLDTTELITFQITTNGCNGLVIDSRY